MGHRAQIVAGGASAGGQPIGMIPASPRPLAPTLHRRHPARLPAALSEGEAAGGLEAARRDPMGTGSALLRKAFGGIR